MTVTFAQKLERMPHYEAGLHEDAARETFGADDVVKLASNESPWAAASRRRRGDRRAAAGAQPLPGPARDSAAARADRRALRARPGADRGRQRLLRDPARGARGALRAGRRDRLRLAVVLDLPAPGGRSRARARSGCRSPTATSTTSTRWLAEVTAATQLVLRLQPEQPDRHPPAGRRGSREFCRARPAITSRSLLDEAYVEFQTDDDPDATRRPAGRVPEPGGRCAPSARSTASPGCACGYALCSARLPRRGRRGAPAVQRQRARPGGGGRGHPPPRRRRRRGSSARSWSGSSSRRASRELGPRAADLAGELLLGRRSATATRARWSRALGERGRRRARRRGARRPGHIRVTYGTRAENERFLAAPRRRPRRLTDAAWAGLAEFAPSAVPCYKRRDGPRLARRLSHRPPGAAPACLVLLLLAI